MVGAQELGLPQQSISRALSLLKLGPELQARIDAGTLAPTIGHELARIDDEIARAALLARIEAEGLKRDEVAAAVKASNSSAGKGRGDGPGKAKRGTNGKSSRAAARKVTRKVLKLAGYKVTIERAKGLDDDYCQVIAEALLAEAEPAHGRGGAPEEDSPATAPASCAAEPILSDTDDGEKSRGAPPDPEPLGLAGGDLVQDLPRANGAEPRLRRGPRGFAARSAPAASARTRSHGPAVRHPDLPPPPTLDGPLHRRLPLRPRLLRPGVRGEVLGRCGGGLDPGTP